MTKGLSVIPLALLLFLFAVGPIAAQERQDLSGTYTNDQLTVRLGYTGDDYTGLLVVGGERIPLTVQTAEADLIGGTYSFRGQTFPFRAIAQGQALQFQAEGRQFLLERQTGASEMETGAAGGPDGDAEETSPRTESETADGPTGDDANRIRNENWGLTFLVPEGWQARAVQGESAYILGSSEIDGLMLVLPTTTPTLEQLRVDMQQGVHEDGGTALHPDGEIATFGEDGLAAEYRGSLEGQSVRAYVASRIAPEGMGASVLVATEPTAFDRVHRTAARRLARKIQFFQPETTPVVAEWQKRLRGRVLSKYRRYNAGGGGSTSRTTIDLCAAGHFYHSRRHQASFNTGEPTGGYATGARQGAGHWEVIAQSDRPRLRLTFHDGDVWTYELGWGDNIPGSSSRYTSLDGDNYLRTPSERPDCGS